MLRHPRVERPDLFQGQEESGERLAFAEKIGVDDAPKPGGFRRAIRSRIANLHGLGLPLLRCEKFLVCGLHFAQRKAMH